MKNRITKPGLVAMNHKVACQFCDKETTVSNIKKHENACYLNPDNIRECAVCEKPIKDYKKSKGTCSHSCSNIYFKTLRNKDERLGYQALCFRYHEKKCIVCGEDKIVAAHHVNHDHHDDRPENLVPLCPTHHQYVHSKYKDEVQPIIESYLETYSA